jgi:hypothetical protein
MRVDLKRRNPSFKTKNTNKQPTSSDRRKDERHNIVNGVWMHSGDDEVVTKLLIWSKNAYKHKKEKKKKKNRKERSVGVMSRRGRGEKEEADVLLSPLKTVFKGE